MVDPLVCVTLCRCEPAIPDQGSRLIPFAAPISSRTGSSRLRRGPLTCEAHDGAVLRCGNPVLVPLDPLPLRHHVDRSALLLQLRTGSVHGRGGRGDQERRDAEARAARAVVVPLERGRHVPGRRRHPGAAACQLERSLGAADYHGCGFRHRDARQCLARDLAQSENRDRQCGGHRGRRQGESGGGGSRGARVSGVPHQRRFVFPHAVLHGRGVAFHAPRQQEPRPLGRDPARDPRVARDQRVGGNDGTDEETDRDGPRRDSDRSGDGTGRLLDRPGRAELARGLTLAAATSTTLPVGAVAPDFALPSTAGTDVTLSAFRGRNHVLLAFFPLAFTSTCTAENCAFSEDYEAFERAGTIVLPISVDSVPTLKEYKAKHAMRQDLLSDFKREVSRAYGVLLEDRFFSKRAYFLIDRQGILRWRHIEAELGARRDDVELLRQIAAL